MVAPRRPCGIVIRSHGRISSLMPSSVITRSQTSDAGAGTTLTCSTSVATARI